MKGPEEIRAAADARMERHCFDVDGAWPFAVAIGVPAAQELREEPTQLLRQDAQTERWAAEHGLEIAYGNRRVGPVTQRFVSRVTIPSEAVALKIVSRKTAQRRRTALERCGRLCDEFGVEPSVAMGVVKSLRDEPDAGFDLVVKAAAWFRGYLSDNGGAGGDRERPTHLTARMVPLPGFSAKWLDGERSRRRKAICVLLGIASLPLEERPAEVRFRYLAPAAAGWAERMATAWLPSEAPEMDVSRVIITENKDTYLALPALERTVTLFGSGRAVKEAPDAMPWLRGSDGGNGGSGASLDVVYWGDLDADGFEILSDLRKAGVACRSICMDMATLDAFGDVLTQLSPEGSAIKPRAPKENLSLTEAEYEAYREVCCGPRGIRRIEQERIPLPYALGCLEPEQ